MTASEVGAESILFREPLQAGLGLLWDFSLTVSGVYSFWRRNLLASWTLLDCLGGYYFFPRQYWSRSDLTWVGDSISCLPEISTILKSEQWRWCNMYCRDMKTWVLRDRGDWPGWGEIVGRLHFLMEVGPGWYEVGCDKKRKECGKTKQNPTTEHNEAKQNKLSALVGKISPFYLKGSWWIRSNYIWARRNVSLSYQLSGI